MTARSERPGEPGEPGRVRGKWSHADCGRHYADSRWKSSRRARRDLELVTACLDRWAPRRPLGRVLDAPSGTGRLRPALTARARHYVGLEFSAAMQAQDAGGAGAHLVRGDAFRLPFAGGAFEAVVACRFLHHLHGEDDLLRAVAELVRVSSRLVVASFWDAASLPAWRRRLGLAKDEGPSGRRAHPKRAIRAAFEAAGARVVGFRHSFRFVSQQTFAAAVVREPAGGDPG